MPGRRPRKAPQAPPELVAERVEHIASLMREHRYKRGVTSKELAAEWSLSVSTVENYTAEASRRVLSEYDDPDRVHLSGCTALETALDGAMADREWGDVARLADVLTRVTSRRTVRAGAGEEDKAERAARLRALADALEGKE